MSTCEKPSLIVTTVQAQPALPQCSPETSKPSGLAGLPHCISMRPAAPSQADWSGRLPDQLNRRVVFAKDIGVCALPTRYLTPVILGRGCVTPPNVFPQGVRWWLC